MVLRRIPALLVLVIVFTVGLTGKPAQEEKTVWQGVYTDTQAARGRVYYEESCSRCHATDLSGNVGGSLKGDVFKRDWSGETVGAFFDRIKTTMPRGAVGSLSDNVYVDIVAYILQVNSFPANPTAELKADLLHPIRIENKEGPGFVPNFSLVEAVGCLAQAPDKVWILTDATDVVRTRETGAPNADVLKAAGETQLGKGQLRLLYIFPAPDALKGHKVHSKGLLIRDPNGDSINVTSLRSLAPTCK
jgi:mono/diheme cytochrome c family protein